MTLKHKFFSLFVCLISISSNLYSQNTDPSEEETFKFIVYMINKSKTGYVVSSDNSQNRIDVGDLYMKHELGVDYSMGSLIELDKLIKVENLGFFNSSIPSKKGFTIKLHFTEKYFLTKRGVVTERFFAGNNFNVSFEEAEDSQRFYKALLHLLSMNKVNKYLFRN